MSIAPLPPVTAITPLAPRPTCRIEGTGDRNASSDEPFGVYDARGARTARLVIHSPGEAHVAWSDLPSIAGDDRARIEIGGQEHVKYTGYASLRGRTFSLKKRFVAEPDHVWSRAGAPAEIVAFEDGAIVARVATPFAAPKTIDVRGACEDVVYAADPPQAESPSADVALATASVAQPTLDLFASPEVHDPFMTITLDPSRNLVLQVVARSGTFSRVQTLEDEVLIDAWVRTQDIDEQSLFGFGMSGGSSSECGGIAGTRMTVPRDTPLFVGAKPTELAGAVIESGAEVYASLENVVVIDGREIVPFTFTDDMIEAPEGSNMWIDRAALRP